MVRAKLKSISSTSGAMKKEGNVIVTLSVVKGPALKNRIILC